MRQFVFEQEPILDAVNTVSGRDAHYLAVVLRLKLGDTFPAIDQRGTKYLCELKEATADTCSLFVSAIDNAQPITTTDPYPNITLYQCVSKGKRMDIVVRQATEAGVNTIVPVISERTVPRYKDGETEKKQDRWKRIAREAVQQCGRSIYPAIIAPMPIAHLPSLTDRKESVGLCFHESPLENGSIHGYLSGEPEEVSIAIGPEGGLAKNEQGLLARLGYRFCFLGPNVLRTETAALYAVAAVITVLAEKESWQKRY